MFFSMVFYFVCFCFFLFVFLGDLFFFSLNYFRPFGELFGGFTMSFGGSTIFVWRVLVVLIQFLLQWVLPGVVFFLGGEGGVYQFFVLLFCGFKLLGGFAFCFIWFSVFF